MHSGHEIKLQQSCSMDWVLAKIENARLVEYTGIEVQSIDITNNYRDNWYAYKNISENAIIPRSEHGMNWANVHKRLIPQIIRKSLIYSRSSFVNSGLYFIVPDIVYKKFEDIITCFSPEERCSKSIVREVPLSLTMMEYLCSVSSYTNSLFPR